LYYFKINTIQAAANLEAFKTLPGRCHELKGDKKGQLSLDLEHPLRLIFEPTNNANVAKDNDSGMDWNLVNAIKIIDVEDTHD
jgi:proteic killer suppression protein